ncbi:YTH domain-containing protein ECT4-like [Hevea brasiliensis]|uniref:YTH domain-containing protein ECT4-like n=1 Tax=Hevea brasiliensis TaxID=3981 RepID=UPI0025E25A3D|nr:YTH domain-containing protein ECT4-like [Hevea brasiliensis]
MLNRVNLGFYRSTIAAGTELEKPESVPTRLKSESIRKLAGRDVASGKDGLPCGSTSFSCFSRDATSSTKGEVDGNSGIKGETDQESVGDLGIYNPPTSSYNYYYPEYNGSFSQLDDHGYFQADGSHMVLYRLITSGMQSDNGSLVYYLPGYNPYASGAVVGVDGQSVGQQAYFSSPGYLPHPVFYGSEAMPCYSWDSAYFSDVSNGNTGSQNGKYGSASTFAKSSGFNSMKSNDNTAGKSSKSTNTQAIRPLNKVSALGSDFSAGLSKGYHPVGNLPPFSIQKHGPFPHNCPMNYRQNGRIWNGNDRNKSGDRFYKNSDFETSNELTSGPRGSNKFPSLETAVKEDSGITVQRDQYNKPDFETKYADAKFYVIKSYNEDDIHKSIKYDVWASTPNGNEKLDAAFCEAEQRS